MAKASFARGTLTYNLVNYGITDIELGEEYSEIDVTDTESTLNESEYLGGRRSRPISFNLFKDAMVADLPLNQQESSQTSGTLTVGQAYRLTDWITNDDFTNVGAGSNADGVEFIATGTTPTTWTNSSIVTKMIEVTLKVQDASGTYTTYSGNITFLTKRVTGNIDGAVVVAYTGRAIGALAEAQG